MSTVLVTGARGNTGSVVVNHLHGNSINVVAGVTQLPDADISESIVESRLCRYGDQRQILQALEGVDTVFMMVPFGREMVEQGRQFIEAARDCGVTYIVRLSGLAAAPDSASAMGRLHGQIDLAVKASGIDYCILRCNSFMQNFTGHYCKMVKHGKLYLPHGDARISFIDTADIGEVAANVIKSPELYKGKTLDLGGPEALSNDDVVGMISSEINKVVDYFPISIDQACEGFRKLGLDEWDVNVFRSLETYLGSGHAAGDCLVLEQVLGRKAHRFVSFAQQNKFCWL